MKEDPAEVGDVVQAQPHKVSEQVRNSMSKPWQRLITRTGLPSIKRNPNAALVPHPNLI